MDDLILTRYLYSYIEVKGSLFLSILDRKIDEALHWAYELYWSGYTDETIDYLFEVYNIMYEKEERMERRLIEEYNKWKVDNTKHEVLGTILINICHQKYKISKFIETFFQIKCEDKDEEKKSNKLFIVLNMSNVKKHETLYDYGKRDKILKLVYKYKLRTEYSEVFENPKMDMETRKNELRMNWETYAYRCPYWKEAIDEYNGRIEDNKIKFDNDDNLEEFYEKYYLDMDEQPGEIQDIALGINGIKKKSMKEFIENYNGILSTKKVKKKITIS